jgi:hypothetical protein
MREANNMKEMMHESEANVELFGGVTKRTDLDFSDFFFEFALGNFFQAHK